MSQRKKVLIADDSGMNRQMIAAILGEQYTYTYAANGVQAIDYLSEDLDVDILLLDINMPGMDGFEVLRIMNERHWIEEIPVVVISAESDSSFLQRAYALGATDYIPRPFSAVAVQFRVKNTLMLYTKQRQLVQLVEEQVLEREEINNAMINIFSHTVELRNNESGRHSLNIRDISDLLLHRLVEISDRYPLTEKSISVITSLSALHDIGKISIPRSILNKPGRLTSEEFAIMKTHSAQGDEIIASAAIPQSSFVVRTAREICRWHHERWDGRGYPDGLAGDDIPISAQVVSLADVYDALTSERCYKKAFSHEQAVRMICGGECGAFNPLLLQCLNDVAPALKELLGETPNRYDEEDKAQLLTSEVLRHYELPLDDRSRRLLANEKEKKEFFKQQAGGIQFEYDRPAKKVTFTNWYGEKSTTEVEYLSEGDHIELLSREDWTTLFRRTGEARRGDDDVTMEVMIPVNGEQRRHRLTARTVWPQRGSDYVSILGQFTDIHDEER